MFFTKINHHCSEERQGLSHASSRTAAAPIIFCTNTLRAFLNCSHSCSCTSSTTTTMKGLIPPCPHQQHHLHHHQRHRQQCQQQRHTLSVIRNSRSRSTAAIAAAAAPELGQHSTHAEPQHAAQSSRATQQQQQQQQQQTDTRRGRLLIKQQPGHGRSPSSSRLDDLQQALPASLHQVCIKVCVALCIHRLGETLCAWRVEFACTHCTAPDSRLATQHTAQKKQSMTPSCAACVVP